MFYYTGVGSRKTPEDVCKLFTYLAAHLGSLGGVLRSGHADGADMAFEVGVPLVDPRSQDKPLQEIYLPWKAFNGRRKYYDPFTDDAEDDQGYYVPDDRWPSYPEAVKKAKAVIPWWSKLKDSHRLLHTRNVYQVYGKDLKSLSALLLCWSVTDSNSNVTGGTRTAVAIAASAGVPVFNRYDYEDDDAYIDAVVKYVKTHLIKDTPHE